MGSPPFPASAQAPPHATAMIDKARTAWLIRRVTKPRPGPRGIRRSLAATIVHSTRLGVHSPSCRPLFSRPVEAEATPGAPSCPWGPEPLAPLLSPHLWVWQPTLPSGDKHSSESRRMGVVASHAWSRHKRRLHCRADARLRLFTWAGGDPGAPSCHRLAIVAKGGCPATSTSEHAELHSTQGQLFQSVDHCGSGKVPARGEQRAEPATVPTCPRLEGRDR